MYFEVSGVQVSPAIPFLVAFVASFLSSMGGLSGAFLLLPFQVSVLGFTSPAVSPTNLVYNIVAIPSGVYRYIKEGRMAWMLTGIIIAGTIPGVFMGAILRIKYLPDPKRFKFFVGCVLLYIGFRLVHNLIQGKNEKSIKNTDDRLNQAYKKGIRTVTFSLAKSTYRFLDEDYAFNTMGLFLLTFVVGIVGGVYGIGGGAIIAPFLVTFYRLPVYTIAGAALLGTLITSLAGVFFYTIIAPYYADSGVAVSPDWMLGILFGAGGFAGMYCGARLQKFMPERLIKVILASLILFISIRYTLIIFKF
ncbi:MAG: sulfite exporter TauE/SafE family protein [Deltaproteobacteria bacterium]|nr:sulfite exporter TauE/SafE family protein [Deltaproteobacteria bacterium]MBW1985134.1 sulfite exporter TauE/SafE family protein [Deltaproteobacteria bacterium]